MSVSHKGYYTLLGPDPTCVLWLAYLRVPGYAGVRECTRMYAKVREGVREGTRVYLDFFVKIVKSTRNLKSTQGNGTIF